MANNNNKNVVDNKPLFGLLCIVLLVASVSLILSAVSVARLVKIDRFYAETSEDYRRINELDAMAAAPSENGNDAQPQAAAGGGDETACVDQGRLDLDGEPFIGDEDAPVTIVEYSDYECPFCGRFWSSSYQQIKENYIDTGQARLIYKDYPLNFHPLAKPAAVIANCIQANFGNERYFEYHDQIFSAQGSLSNANLREWAFALSLTEGQLEACENDDQYAQEVDDDFTEGSSIGVSGTPTFVINGELVVGARPYRDFEAAIDRALNGEGCES